MYMSVSTLSLNSFLISADVKGFLSKLDACLSEFKISNNKIGDYFDIKQLKSVDVNYFYHE